MKVGAEPRARSARRIHAFRCIQVLATIGGRCASLLTVTVLQQEGPGSLKNNLVEIFYDEDAET